MIKEHQERIQREIKKAEIRAFFLNTFFIYYTFFIAYFFYLEWTETSELNLSLLSGLVIPAIILAAVWTKLGKSLGHWVEYRVNRFLKQNLKPDESGKAAAFSRFFGIALLILTVILGYWVVAVDFVALLSSEGLAGANRIFSAMIHPEMTSGMIRNVLLAMVETIFLALMSTCLAIPLAFLSSFFCARNLVKPGSLGGWIYISLRFIFNFTRSVEPLIWAIIFSVWVGIGPFAGMLALMLHSVASLAKLYSEQIESIDRGPIEAIEATGANRVQTIWYAVVPQIFLPYLAFTIYRWDINIRMGTIIGLVGGGGIGTLLMHYQGQGDWHAVGTIVIAIAFVVWVMDYVSAKLREAIY